MKSDISRQTFDPKKHYSQVIMQQGRVQLDADWNEQQAIILHRAETATRDIIGPNGAPATGGGFRIQLLPGDRDFLIQPGRIYVDGILCELEEGSSVGVQKIQGNDRVVVDHWIVDSRAWNVGQWVELLDQNGQQIRYYQIRDVDANERILTLHTDQDNYPHLTTADRGRVRSLRRVLTYTSQPNYPAPPYTKKYPAGWRALELDGQSLLLVYLDVWQRDITVFQDVSLREVALNGADTTTRLQTLWQVKILPIALPGDLNNLIAAEKPLLEEVAKPEEASHTHTSRGRETSPANRRTQAQQQLNQLEGEIMNRLQTYTCDYPYPEWDTLLSPSTGTLNVITHDPAFPQRPGYQGHENQLYRVEVHTGTDSSNPTFKWARNNASILASGKIKDKNEADTVIIQSAGQGGVLQFKKGQYVEVVSDEAELNGQQPADLKGITRIVQDQITLDSGLPLEDGGENTTLTLRLWDGQGDISSDGPIALPGTGGIKLQFSNGTYKSSDYWLIPARIATQEVEWPHDEDPNNPLPQLPWGNQHHYTRLARVRWYESRLSTHPRETYDCRKRFVPLPAVVEAMHITGINWNNDTTNPRRILRNGLQITLDAEPDQRHARAMAEDALVVTLEAHIPGGAEGIFILDGDSQIRGNSISWHWNWVEKEGIVVRLFKDIDRLGNRVFGTSRSFLRVRVRLKGHVIWHTANGRPVYLDGQAFAMPGGDRGDGRQRLHLQFPSGNGVRASDFESWFYIRE
jgi:Family of unknown function (DUF6519)